MDDASFEVLESGTEDEVIQVLTEFNRKHAQTFTFPDLNGGKKKKLLDNIFRHLRNGSTSFCQLCLETVRILSRDKFGLDELFTPDMLNTMVRLAGLVTEEEAVDECNKHADAKVIVEAQKSLCNVIYNSPSVQRICSSNGCIEGIMLRLRMYKDPNLPHDIKFFDMRMLFLLTALCADVRPKLRNELHGLIYLTEVLDLIIKNNAEKLALSCSNQQTSGKKRFSKGSRRGRSSQSDGDSCLIPCLDDQEVDLACEVLKVLFNLRCCAQKYNLDEEEEAHFMRLVSILHDILLCDTKTKEKKEELQSQTVNLLTNVPPSSYEELLTPLTEAPSDKGELEFDGMNMEAVSVLLDFLDKRLDCKDGKTFKENLSPILSCLGECCRSNRIIRKFLRLRVLPPLKDVKSRPEEGTTLRNRLVKLMTSPLTDIKELVADFLFVLCKENVTRFVKYTGYGNAAGLLANRGLMLGGRGKGNYSSESEDSDTEEYLKYKDRINPVLGCYQEPKRSPMEGMSEEQKEHEAVQLVNMMEKLTRRGLVQPMRVGNDGRPYPIKHVLEFCEGIERKHGSGSESD